MCLGSLIYINYFFFNIKLIFISILITQLRNRSREKIDEVKVRNGESTES